ncbi:MAG: aminoacyl-tRNA hydrolase, partial [Paracoccaceae bacterium]
RVAGYVLHDFAKADQVWLDDVLRGIGDGAPDLAAGDSGKFMNAVALRAVPSRPSKPAKAASKSPEPIEQDDPRNPMQKLLDKFR